MKKFGLIGHPIAHSLSPALFKAAYDGRYSYDLIEEEDFEKAYERFLKEYDAINVTAPFKELAAAKAEIMTPECEAIGAANILIKTENGILAANSDNMGVIGAIESATKDGFKIKPTALIVGCGGAAKAAAYATCCTGYHTIILNRDLEKAIKFAEKLQTNPMFDVVVGSLDSFGECFKMAGLIVYTLPVAIPDLHQLSRQQIRGGSLWTRQNKILVEANYKDPAFTKELLERLQGANPKLKYVSGREWLLHQAVGAYRTFTLEESNIENMRKVL